MIVTSSRNDTVQPEYTACKSVNPVIVFVGFSLGGAAGISVVNGAKRKVTERRQPLLVIAAGSKSPAICCIKN